MTTYAPSTVADDLYDDEVRPKLRELVGSLLEVEDPIARLGAIARLEERLKPILEATKTFAVREARDGGETLATIGAALGVSHQRAHQIATNNVPQEDTKP